MKQLRLDLDYGERVKLSDEICNKVLKLSILKKADIIACYIAKPEEVQTEKLILKLLDMGKKVVIPKVNPGNKGIEFYYLKSFHSELEKGYHGIMEPKTLLKKLGVKSHIDFAIVPSLALDITGTRIGFGGGYFDRFFSPAPERTTICGIAFDFQILDTLPSDPHDINVDLIVTEKRTINCSLKHKSIN
ncbi:MAG: 5-formyltetrahydrofolate cyclo-ligase [Candidatus Schekmanbacteria bacterium]|nr:5-formyltetrahydrofolate cyclo-ligase [Candidatus Schekmanbacteria bacterium]